ncbi:MAG TPA: CotH kinase family protein [Candidatus Saccharimonadales bacterium]|nr:CotH kinase family protein [Candidatus Saccharimonadales bacterium]
MRFPGGWVLAILLALQGGAAQSAPRAYTVRHSPEQPKSGETVRIIASGTVFDGLSNLTLQYQVVEPGKYIALADSAYAKSWTSVSMSRGVDPAAGPSYAVELPAVLQKHRRLVRYRIAAGDKLVAPAQGDSETNFAYFVYDGVPAWRGAINPESNDPLLKEARVFSSEVMQSVQVYQFIAGKQSVENVTWYEPGNIYDEKSRHAYKYTGTLVVHGKVYDHIRFRARGGEWRHAMGKNMWKFDFNRGHHLDAEDDFGRPYDVKWGKLNLGACIQQGSYQTRGEQGVFEAATYRLFNLAGVPAPKTHYVHLRIIDTVVESPASQFEGDFWGLYLATEEIDEHFLEEHNLPAGNIYKWDFGRPRPEYIVPGTPTNKQDVFSFVAGYARPQDEAWWRRNVDLPKYFSYRSIVECVHHYDIAAGKNYFYYFNGALQRWTVLPWDVDLTWRDNMYGTGREPFQRAGLLSLPQLQVEYQNRFREIRDLLYNPEQTGLLLDEIAAVIADPAGGPSFVQADRAKWDHHPIMASRWTSPAKAGQGRFYQGSPTRDFRGMIQTMKDYIVSRGRWCDQNLLTDHAIAPTPSIHTRGAPDLTKPALELDATFAGATPAQATFEWRVAEVTRGSITKPLRPAKYEIEARWQRPGPASFEVPSRLFEKGHTYRIRVRAFDSTFRSSHWSEPIQIRI